MTLVREGEGVQVVLSVRKSTVKLPQELSDSNRYSRILPCVPSGGDIPQDGAHVVGRRLPSACNAAMQVPAEIAASSRYAIRVST